MRYITLDIKDFYLLSKLNECKHIFVELALIPDDFIKMHNLDKIAAKGKVLAEVRGGMCSLRQAGNIAHEDLKTYLAPCGYKPARFTLGLWSHAPTNLSFTLIVDDFGVKFTNISQANHLITALKTKCELSIDWLGRLYCGVSLNWN